ncbi:MULTISPECIES: LysR family transcriptional regulator ArgP [Pseudomonas]|jgi:LysR family transcriptional regulator (chromosome initiation inhibitor)|uniref:HTH-type transcriptional regulator ArgP n=1 Tax=Pseudomonas psychrophila TaxID=122355 RepID=A0ABY0VP35_9PSED|nr:MULTISPECIES: LysR family transcriptional regulator ArgP [Pseudomonas]EPJ92431.1 chromosome replication initiation inhibitor protein [Pseudomonas psychrophila]KAB0493387.1 LysR family transcriptional regulator ArgP [Pseudomonas psychrophila]KMN02739.1 LysR family transcriptional regulator [Pseudomonas psychrophila]KOX66422.1 LysR family transcriptional regulator [Pseudomonas psychrophila]MDY7584006.1 LysR family transcriptional regulator ArgP [Pseudomonas sp. CCI3.1]
MFDYKLLSALAAVVEQAGFERAAQVLGLSQSAISQRIKLLEARIGQPVLIRATPPTPTEIGRRLLNHVQQVRLLERDLQSAVPALDDEGLPERLRIALNADSLATWWAPAVGDFCAEQHLLLDLVVEDQTVGLKRMRAGEVAACLCASERPVAGARSVLLGAMRYRALASPAFIARHFPDGVSAALLSKTPALVFGPDDFLQHRYLAALGVDGGFEHHLCPSSEGFIRLAEAGLGWGLVPELQVREQLERGMLVELLPDKPIDVPLYWHHWRNGGQLLSQLTEHLSRSASRWLGPVDVSLRPRR